MSDIDELHARLRIVIERLTALRDDAGTPGVAVAYDTAALDVQDAMERTGRFAAWPGITSDDLEHLPATFARLNGLEPTNAPQEPTMHVADLNGTHLGKTITVTTKHQTITGTLYRVDHDSDRISDEITWSKADLATTVVGRGTHRLTIGAVDGTLPGDADVEVRA